MKVWSDVVYSDTGCKAVSPSCLNCPLPKCKYDDPEGFLTWKHQHDIRLQDGKLQVVTNVEHTLEEYAAEHGVSLRTAYRHKAKVKK